MCGLAGFLQPSGFALSSSETTLGAMCDALRHRGPDNAGAWIDPATGIALGHRRLSVVDLFPSGHQPMQSHSGRLTIVYNGEIYNHLAIRRRLDKERPINWRGHSDTETLLEAIECWGIEVALKQVVGMFGFAVWDARDRVLRLARDRMGEKPVYYGWQGHTFLFASELPAVVAHPAFRREINRYAVQLYLESGYVPAPWSIWKDIWKLPPGTYATVAGDVPRSMPEIVSYWRLEDQIRLGLSHSVTDASSAVDALEEALRTAVAGQMSADVPVGAFLSGGIDSSTIAALMQAQSPRPIKTFSIGFDETAYDESGYAASVARHLGTEHAELRVSMAHAREVIPRLTGTYGEPFGDASAIPTYLVAHLARQQVTVALSGDGGDELFGGYSRYHSATARHLWHTLRRVPRPVRSVMTAAITGAAAAWLDRLRFLAARQVGLSFGRALAPQVEMMQALASADDEADFYRVLVRHWKRAPLRKPLPHTADRTGPSTAARTRVEVMMEIDSGSYLPDDILVKVDRAAMAHSLETRVPLLDHRVVELAWRMPLNVKVRDGVTKWPLRQVLYRYVPPHLVERPKMGFGVPIDEWLRGPLRDWAEHLLSPSRLESEGLLDGRAVTTCWRQHVDHQWNWRDRLWLVLMLQSWIDENRPVS